MEVDDTNDAAKDRSWTRWAGLAAAVGIPIAVVALVVAGAVQFLRNPGIPGASVRLWIYNDSDRTVIVRRIDEETVRSAALEPETTLKAVDRYSAHDPILGNFSFLGRNRADLASASTPTIGVFSGDGHLLGAFVLPLSDRAGLAELRLCVSQATLPSLIVDYTMAFGHPCPPKSTSKAVGDDPH